MCPLSTDWATWKCAYKQVLALHILLLVPLAQSVFFLVTGHSLLARPKSISSLLP